MTTTVGALAFVPPPSKPPLVGDSPAIAVATYPNGTPLSLTRLIGKRFNLTGKKVNGDDNAATLHIGTSGTIAKKPVPLAAGDAGITVLECDDGHFINLADYYMLGTDGDGVKWIRIS